MIGVLARRRDLPGPAHFRASRPSFESLEDRVLLYSTIGGRWANPVEISYSIVPDGTSIGGTPSNLQAVLGTTPGWQQQIQKAAAAWEAVAGINLVQVPDDGSPIGIAGNQQDDPRFGDIRIGGMTQAGGQLGFAFAPPPFNGGTNAGDIFFNTAQSWQTNGQTYDLMTVAIHEFGHALGMGHSAIISAVMYANYTWAKQTLTSDDAAGIQSIYGAPTPDGSNNSSRAASDITPYITDAGQISLANLDISSSSDVDWYKVIAPASTVGTMTVSMQSSNLSSLIPAVTVYNADFQSAGASKGSSYGSTVSVSASGIDPGQTWYIKAMAATTGPGGAGAYGLLVNFGSSPQSPEAAPDTAVAGQPDQNPTTTALGTGWIIDGIFVPFLQDPLAGVLDLLNQLERITIGSLTGYGDSLDVGNPRRHRHEATRGPGASESPRFVQFDQQWATPNPNGFTAAPVTSVVVDAAVHSRRTKTAAMSSHPRVAASRPESALVRTVDAALEGWRADGLLSMRTSLSYSQGGNHTRGHRMIANTTGGIPP